MELCFSLLPPLPEQFLLQWSKGGAWRRSEKRAVFPTSDPYSSITLPERPPSWTVQLNNNPIPAPPSDTLCTHFFPFSRVGWKDHGQWSLSVFLSASSTAPVAWYVLQEMFIENKWIKTEIRGFTKKISFVLILKCWMVLRGKKKMMLMWLGAMVTRHHGCRKQNPTSSLS